MIVNDVVLILSVCGICFVAFVLWMVEQKYAQQERKHFIETNMIRSLTVALNAQHFFLYYIFFLFILRILHRRIVFFYMIVISIWSLYLCPISHSASSIRPAHSSNCFS